MDLEQPTNLEERDNNTIKSFNDYCDKRLIKCSPDLKYTGSAFHSIKKQKTVWMLSSTCQRFAEGIGINIYKAPKAPSRDEFGLCEQVINNDNICLTWVYGKVVVKEVRCHVIHGQCSVSCLMHRLRDFDVVKRLNECTQKKYEEEGTDASEISLAPMQLDYYLMIEWGLGIVVVSVQERVYPIREIGWFPSLAELFELVKALHAKGIAHCDIGFDNIASKENGQIVLVGWECALILGRGGDEFTTDTEAMLKDLRAVELLA